MAVTTFTERLRQRRKVRGLTQEELADLIGIDRNSIARYERGEVAPKYKALQKLATALNTTTSYLLGETDDPNPTGGFVGNVLLTAKDVTGSTIQNAGHDVNATTVPQTEVLDFSNIPSLAMQMKKQGNIEAIQDAISFLKSAIDVLERAVSSTSTQVTA